MVLAMIAATISTQAFAAEMIQMPMSCYNAVKAEALRYIKFKYPGSHLRIPQIAYDLGNGRINIEVKIINQDWDYPGNLYLPAIVRGNQCRVGRAHE